MPPPLTQRAVNKAIADAKYADVRDGRARGLVLRVRGPNKWEWTIRRAWRGKDYRFVLGAEWSLDEARDLLAHFDLQCRTDDPPFSHWSRQWPAFLAKRRSEKLGVEVKPAPPPPPRVTPPQSLMFKHAMSSWLDDVKRTRRETTADFYRWALNTAEIKPLHSRLVNSITRLELAEAVAAISKRGAERQAESSTIALRRLFKFLGSDAMQRKTNVEPGIMDSLRAPERSLDESDDGANALKVPSADDVARIMQWLNTGSAPERDRLAGKLLVYSVQRRRAVALARRAEFEPAGEFGGLWKIPPLHRKTAAMRARRGLDPGSHVVPLPPNAWAVVKRAISLARDSEFLFPAMQNRRNASPAATIHPSSLTHLFASIPGNESSPHDMRRAFGTTYAQVARLKLYDIKQILDHSEGVNSGDVTREHYSFLTGEHEKWPTIRGWVEWVDTAVAHGSI
ncbi:MAG: integrase family protein [Roseiarcus sp.]|jgi:integrase